MAPLDWEDTNYVYDVKIIDKSNSKASEDKSYSDLLLDMKKIAVRSQAKKKIFDFILKSKKSMLNKARSKIIKSPIILYTLT